MRKQMTKSYYPWLVIFLSASFLFYKYILQVSPSLMTNELMQVFHVDAAELGNLAAMFFYSYVVMQILSGPLLDRFSPRLLTCLAILAAACGALLFSISNTLLEADLSRALIGFGAAFATVSYMKMASLWFKPSQFAFISGLLATAAMSGALFGEAPMAFLVSQVGWEQALFIMGLIGIIIAALFFILVRDHPSFNEANPAIQKHEVSWRAILKILKSSRNWCLMFYSGLAFAPVAVFGGLWGNPFLEEAYHLSRTQAASLTSSVFLGLAIGGPALGFISDRLAKRALVMALGTALTLVSLSLVLYLVMPIWLLVVCLFSFGFGTGAFMIGFVIGKEINAYAMAGTVIAMINTGDALLGAVSEPLTGKLLDIFWSGKMLAGEQHFSIHEYRLALTLLPIYLVLALGFLLIFRLLRTVQKQK